MNFDRTTQDLGNIVEFGHVNIRVPDQQMATIFFIMGLGLTRDPYLVVGVDNTWVNVGMCQFHLPVGPAQVLRGVTGLVMPDLDGVRRRLAAVAPRLAGTKFTLHDSASTIEVTCPWGNRIRIHAPDPARFGPMQLGMPYVELDCAPGTLAGIARFYRDILAAIVTEGSDAQGAFTRVASGMNEVLLFRETAAAQPAYDGHHVQIAVHDFSGTHARLLKHGLITEESNDAQYRFQDIIDPRTGAVLHTIEHEVRSMFARALVNRNPETTNNHYAPGHEAAVWALPPAAPSGGYR